MKVLQINVWNGRIKDGLSRFIAEGEYDVVCMQEAIWSNDCDEYLEQYVDTVDKIARIAGFDYVFKSSRWGTKTLDGSVRFENGNAILSRIPFAETKEEEVFGEYRVVDSLLDCQDMMVRCYKVQKAILGNGVAIVNYHGYYKMDPLGDEVSVECMRRVASFIKSDSCPTIVCGDLNVIAESPAMRELGFMRDLTVINQVKTTLRNIRFIRDVACDHILISDELGCKSFDVVNAAISDHRALVAEIEI